MPPAERLRRNLSDLKRAEMGGTLPAVRAAPLGPVNVTYPLGQWDNGP